MIYTDLSDSYVNNTNVTLTLDAADSKGIKDIVVRVVTSDNIYFMQNMTLVSGSANYGTWSVVIPADRPDNTYYIDRITLYNDVSNKTYNITDRAFYNSWLPQEINDTSSGNSKSNAITGFAVSNWQKIKKNPFGLFSLAVVLTLILTFTIMSFRHPSNHRNGSRKWRDDS